MSNFLRGQGFRHKVVYGEDGNEAWENALNLADPAAGVPENFYRIEWESVVQAQNITSLEAYLQAPRIGRGTRLSREAKKLAWKVFEEYRAQLNEREQKEYVDLARDARQLIETKSLKLPYRAVILDEAQDISAEAFRLIRAIVPKGENDIFIVGDAHQRIYSHRVSLGKCGIDVRGRGKKLKINYRTTDEIRRFATRLLEGRAMNVFATAVDESAWLKQRIAALVEEGASHESICVLTRTKKLSEAYSAALEAAGLSTYTIKRDAAEQRDKPGVRIATMHRIKGLEFDHILIVAVNEGVVPLSYAVESADDAVSQRNVDTGERALLYVALTRAKKSASISAYGTPSPYLSPGRP